MMTARNIFENLCGSWKLERQTIDRLLSQSHNFEGIAVFRESDVNKLHYEEKGEGFSQTYFYELKNEKLVILYGNPYRAGEVLHELEFSDNQSSHQHICGQDLYTLKFIFNEGPFIELNYEVKGPQKDYSIKSVLTPL